jgi:bla regulator protein blaR1
MSGLPFAEVSSSWWPTTGAPIANHLWQSTLFAAVVGLLTLLLRKNHARTRHWLWLLASAKFLIPFSLLVALGSHLGLSRTAANPQAGFFFVMQEINQPFAPSMSIGPVVAAGAPLNLATRVLPMVLLVIWAWGFVAVLFHWWSRSRRMSAAIRGTLPARRGRELETLRRLEQSAGATRQIDLMLSNSALEPGILGILHSVLLLPAGIADRLSDAQLEAIIRHELCHVGRRDNLAAALHMVVEALFWFHPLVWWLGARLVDERERACDEEVLRLGSDPETYAESILKICEFYLESPLLCAAGVTGSNLKKRIEAIMHYHTPLNLNFARKLVLSSAAFLALAIPIAFGLLHTAQIHAQSQSQSTGPTASSFESVYLAPNTTGEPMPPFIVHGRPMQAVVFKPDRFMATNFSLLDLIQLAYRVQALQIVGATDWLSSEKYDVNAKLDSAEIEKLKSLDKDYSGPEHQKLVQALLAEHFKLTVHRESRRIPVYVLAVAPSGSKIRPAKPGDTYANGIQSGPGYWAPKTGEMVSQGMPLTVLVKYLSDRKLARPIVDKTGLSGKYDYTLEWTPDASSSAANATLFGALEQQLGLKLEEQEDLVDVLVIDHAEEVTGNNRAQL